MGGGCTVPPGGVRTRVAGARVMAYSRCRRFVATASPSYDAPRGTGRRLSRRGSRPSKSPDGNAGMSVVDTTGFEPRAANPDPPASDAALIAQARVLVKDLFAPRPAVYWADLIVTVG